MSSRTIELSLSKQQIIDAILVQWNSMGVIFDDEEAELKGLNLPDTFPVKLELTKLVKEPDKKGYLIKNYG